VQNKYLLTIAIPNVILMHLYTTPWCTDSVYSFHMCTVKHRNAKIQNYAKYKYNNK